MTINCKEYTFLLSQADTVSLSTIEKESMQAHRMVCPLCDRYTNHQKIIEKLLPRMEKESNWSDADTHQILVKIRSQENS
jgi:hypothetical protein